MFNRGQSAGKPFDESLANYLSGFTDGEGSFNISVINRAKDYKHGWKISLCFNISQKDDTVPKVFNKFLVCGKIRYRKDGICYFDVRKTEDLVNKVVPFFEKWYHDIYQVFSFSNVKIANTIFTVPNFSTP